MKLAIARIGDAPVGIHSEEAVTVNRDVQWIVGCRNVALGKLLLDRRDRSTDTHLRRPGATQRVGIHVGKMRLRGLETNGR